MTNKDVTNSAISTEKVASWSVSTESPIVLLQCGSFSPITVMHAQLMEDAREYLLSLGHTIVAGYLSPAHYGYGKPGLLPSVERVAMCSLVTSASSWLMTDPWESQQPEYVPSFAVARRVCSELERHTPPSARVPKVFFVCGADLLAAMTDRNRWPQQNVHRLLDACSFVVRMRSGLQIGALKNHKVFAGRNDSILELPGEEKPVSSTLVRERFKQGLSIDHLVHPDVEKYISAHKLFRSEHQVFGKLN